MQFDEAWKLALDEAFEPFLELLFPVAHREIDWSRGYESLDKELRELLGQAETGQRVVDFLAKVWRRTGEEEWVLIHIEVQSQPGPDFALRMFTYNYRLYDLYHRPVASFAVLADERESWRPSEFGYNLWGSEMKFRFPAVKLLDWNARRADLETMTNPIAVVVLTHLETLATRADPAQLSRTKFDLLRRLYSRGLEREQIRMLFRVIDAMMQLPAHLEREFRARFTKLEQERTMAYVTSFERLAKEEGVEIGLAQGREHGVRLGLVQAIERLLKLRFGDAAQAMLPAIRSITDAGKLESVLDASFSIGSPDELQKLLALPA